MEPKGAKFILIKNVERGKAARKIYAASPLNQKYSTFVKETLEKALGKNNI